MEQRIISMREIQRNYKRILEKAKRSKQPVFLGAHGNPRAVLMDIEVFHLLEKKMKDKAKKMKWRQIERLLDEVSASGRQDVSLSDFIRYDRQSH